MPTNISTRYAAFFSIQPSTIFAHNSMLKNLILIVISTIVGLALAEGILRAFVPVRNVGPSFSIYDKTLGKRLKPSLSTTRITPEFKMRFTTNTLGFRGNEPKEFPYRPILFLGDSFTMGYGVSDGQEFPALVERALKRCYKGVDIPVVNAGIGDTGNGRWLKYLRLYVRKYQPRLIMFELSNNDFSDNVRERFFELTPNDELRELPIPPKSIARRLQEEVESVPGLAYLYLVGYVRHALRYPNKRAPLRESNS